MSSTSSENGVTPFEPLLSAEEAYCILLHKLGAEKEKLDDHAKKAENTQNVEAWNDIKGSDPVEDLVNFKDKVFKAMKADFNNQQASLFHSFDSYLEEKVTRSMKEHCDRNQAFISDLESQLKSVQRQTHLAKKRAKDLEKNLEEKQTKDDLSKEECEAEFKKKQELVAKKHRKLIRAVRSVTAFAFPQRHSDMDKILGELLAKSFEPDAYVEEEQEWHEVVEVLLRTDMVVRHPDDKRKIRIVDFL